MRTHALGQPARQASALTHEREHASPRIMNCEPWYRLLQLCPSLDSSACQSAGQVFQRTTVFPDICLMTGSSFRVNNTTHTVLHRKQNYTEKGLCRTVGGAGLMCFCTTCCNYF